jgi:hypothetical protein
MNFGLYFNLGVEHITDPYGYDHILFIIAICATYMYKNLKSIAILVTAFTVGHSIALALAILNIVPVYPPLIEFLIPVTILASCIHNILQKPRELHPPSKTLARNNMTAYIGVLLFGLIHGLGFSNFLRETLVASESIFTPLLAFNLGLEVGQLLIVLSIFIINYIFVGILHRKQHDWNLFVSGGVASLTSFILVEKAVELFSNTN